MFRLPRTLVLVGALLALPGIAWPAARGGEPSDVVRRWNDAMLRAIAQNPPAPTHTCWRMYAVHASMYEAWAAYDDVALGVVHGAALRRPPVQRTPAARREAVSHAAYHALAAVFPAQEPQFRAVLADLGYAPGAVRGWGNPAGLGRRCAEDVLSDRALDGANFAGGFAPVLSAAYPEPYVPRNSADPDAPNAPGGPAFDPNRWQPLRVPTGTRVDDNGWPVAVAGDPASYRDQAFLSPHWGAVRPFALTSGAQFRPPPPPQFGSFEPYTDALGHTSTGDAACHAQFDEVLSLSAALDDRGKVIAEFWADGPRTWTPPGHWNQLAHGVSIRDGHTLDDDVRMFFALNGALLDASIAAWECKRHYDLIRPVSAIRHHHHDETIEAWGGPDRGTVPIPGATWRPYQSLTFVTPPFPEYVSGHSTFSRAGREVLLAFSGSDAMYDGVTRLRQDYDGDGVEDLFGQHIAIPGALQFESGPAETVVLRWDTLLDAAIEAGLSRLYGGIHIQDGNLRGQELGHAVGLQAFARARSFWSGGSADVTPIAAGGNLPGGRDVPFAAGAGAVTPAVSLALASANPSAGGFALRYVLPAASPVRLAVYDLSGRRVRDLAAGPQAAGAHVVTWDGDGAHGRPAPAGVYVVRLDAGARSAVLKVARLP